MGFSFSQTLTATKSDNFTRANENPLTDGGNWGVVSTIAKPQLLSNLVEPLGTSAGYWAIWTGSAWANNQYSEITIQTCAVTTAADSALVRCQSGAITCYAGTLNNAASGG